MDELVWITRPSKVWILKQGATLLSGLKIAARGWEAILFMEENCLPIEDVILAT